MSEPILAVVGHPNKGKSSIVATLARQDAVKISAFSGTTTRAQRFTLEIDGQRLLSLVDTPGFQRPRQLLDWLQQHCENAAQRPEVLRQFMAEFSAQESFFHDETELLKPIVDGAGILYVVDGSVPYSAEYESEMTVLQWSGQPRMALINPIGGDAFVDQWRQALSQYFSVVRLFDPMSADSAQQKAILSAFAELSEDWRQPLQQAVVRLEEHQRQLRQSAAVIAVDGLLAMLSHVETLAVPAEFTEQTLQQGLKQRYQSVLREQERAMQRRLQELYGLSHMQVNESEAGLSFPDLFDQDYWYLFGLDRSRLVALSASAGAVAGVAVDVGVGGASLMTGALAGGLISGLASLVATRHPDRIRFKGVPLAGKKLSMGPVRDSQFSFILLGRAIDFIDLLSRRTHADRREARLGVTDFRSRMAALSQAEQVRLTTLLLKARKGLSAQELLKLQATALELMQVTAE